MSFSRFYNSLKSRTPEGLDDMRVIVQAVINDREQYKRVLEARGDEAQQCLDALQVLAETPETNRDPRLRSSILRMMLHLSKRSGLCPNCLNIKNVKKVGEHPVGGGGFGDVWKGKIDNEVVCLKMVKVYQMSDVQKLVKEYMREAIVWQQLHHPNLLPFMGLYYLDKAQEQLCLVSPWMDRGNLVRYLKDTPREAVDHQALACDVASGLAHLHSMKIVHGDLKGVNVLMTPEERACITDFGLSRVADTHSLRLSTTTGQAGGTTRWLAPELLQSDPPSSVSTSTDMYAYACVCYEIFTGGNMPFQELAEGAVMVAVVLNKKHPSRPSGVGELRDEMWDIMIACWNHNARDRPAAKNVCSAIGGSSSRKTGLLISSYPAPKWDAHLLAHVRKNVKYPLVDTTAVMRSLRKGLPPGSFPADDQTYVVVSKTEDARIQPLPPPSGFRGKQKRSSNAAPGMLSLPVPTPYHHRSQSDGNLPGGNLDYSAESSTPGASPRIEITPPSGAKNQPRRDDRRRSQQIIFTSPPPGPSTPTPPSVVVILPPKRSSKKKSRPRSLDPNVAISLPLISSSSNYRHPIPTLLQRPIVPADAWMYGLPPGTPQGFVPPHIPSPVMSQQAPYIHPAYLQQQAPDSPQSMKSMELGDTFHRPESQPRHTAPFIPPARPQQQTIAVKEPEHSRSRRVSAPPPGTDIEAWRQSLNRG
ncbi:Receptor-interacting serine/threonine-protein kinase 1 [Marasmius tenuissimus]|nr:Receptor-interacting serine/threonine-protein kinase 1 [Marasmius tenuissimus]